MPSELLDITHPLRAFYFNRAVAVFGTRVDAEIDEMTRDKKNAKAIEAAANMAVAKWIETADVRKSFRAPQPTM
jgi:hypothetical protein